MAFTARIVIEGLFRMYPDRDQGRLIALAPWTGPVPSKSDDGHHEPSKRQCFVPKKERKMHRFLVGWWPYDLGYAGKPYAGMPPNAMTLWQVPGMEVTFEFQGNEEAIARQKLDLEPFESLRIPRMTSSAVASGKPNCIVPSKWRDLAALRQELIEKRPEEFTQVDDPELGLTTHLGFAGNYEGISGRVIIDRGKLRTDDLTSFEASLKPSLWPKSAGESLYRGYFTNRVAVVVEQVEAVVVKAQNLITGKQSGEITLTRPSCGRPYTFSRNCRPFERHDYLFVSVTHLCPENLLSECPDPIFKLHADRDDDFRYLYELSRDPSALRSEMLRRQPWCHRKVPVPTRFGDPNACRPSRCGSCRY